MPTLVWVRSGAAVAKVPAQAMPRCQISGAEPASTAGRWPAGYQPLVWAPSVPHVLRDPSSVCLRDRRRVAWLSERAASARSRVTHPRLRFVDGGMQLASWTSPWASVSGLGPGRRAQWGRISMRPFDARKEAPDARFVGAGTFRRTDCGAWKVWRACSGDPSTDPHSPVGCDRSASATAIESLLHHPTRTAHLRPTGPCGDAMMPGLDSGVQGLLPVRQRPAGLSYGAWSLDALLWSRCFT